MAEASRRLAALLSADVAGYSRLMGDDEKETISALTDCFGIFRTHFEAYDGRLVDTAGDSLLGLFESVIDAVQCAVAAQRSLATWNAGRPANRQMRFRIGINLGDVFLQRDGHVYGNGVNVAARLQAFAEAGSICVSEAVRGAIGSKLPAIFDACGEQHLKNIAVPVSVYRVSLTADAALPERTPEVVEGGEGPIEIVYASNLIERVLEQVRLVAPTNATVLIQGESGVGKELIARRIHLDSPRSRGPFVKVDCASIPHEQFESELFGHVAGAMPGAMRDRLGHLDLAHRGTLFLSHVAEIPESLQAKLLRPLHDSTFERVGDNRARRADVHFIVATNRNLEELVSQGRFRRDLFFRLSVFPIEMPPLRARTDDIPVLVAHFLTGRTSAASCLGPDMETHMRHLQKYDWPGNVRELKNVVERAVILSGDGPLRFDEALPSSAISYPARAPLPEERTPARGFLTTNEFEELERNNLVAALETTSWRVGGADGAAAQLGVTVAKLKLRMKALGIEKPNPTSLYARLGGNRGIATFARDLFGRAVAHPQLGRFWRGRSTYGILREEKMLTAYLSAVAGGPARYLGRDMKSSHRGLGITANDWEIFLTLLSDTLEALRIPSGEREEVVKFAESLRSDIVQG
jgi:DNA-binding NtrC family response regulator/truncated hemoglobin YjbI